MNFTHLDLHQIDRQSFHSRTQTERYPHSHDDPIKRSRLSRGRPKRLFPNGNVHNRRENDHLARFPIRDGRPCRKLEEACGFGYGYYAQSRKCPRLPREDCQYRLFSPLTPKLPLPSSFHSVLLIALITLDFY